ELMKTYVISLSHAKERRDHIQAEFGKQGIEFEFFDAVTPIDTLAVCQQLGLSLHYNNTLSDGEKACLLSHALLWQKMIDENLDYLAVFEDDVCLGREANLVLTSSPFISDFDVIKLETYLELTHTRSTNYQLGGVECYIY
ncbi:glycosyltransferase family 25 protein, partial [Moraxella canis]